MRYKPRTPLRLTKLSLDIEPGHKVGIVGRTGAGKSTICLVLSRIIELAGGKFVIDGKQSSRVNINKLRDCITVIP
jgi:ATP-binding cassette subfamily C (CFTR/MRP) protein 1